jgi:hypothetical protein
MTVGREAGSASLSMQERTDYDKRNGNKYGEKNAGKDELGFTAVRDNVFGNLVCGNGSA